jgi:EAL domain-containing protein (putative c-di-GMP-specific phosphodiesterase class I)
VGLTRGIDVDAGRRALAAALISFGDQMGVQIVAEGIETTEELEILRGLGARYGQGYYLGRPGPLP